MPTIRNNAMLILRYMYDNGAGWSRAISGNEMRRNFPKMTDKDFGEAEQFLAFAQYVEGASSNDGGHYHMTATGVEAIDREIQTGSFLKRKGDDLILLLLGAVIGILSTLGGAVLLRVLATR